MKSFTLTLVLVCSFILNIQSQVAWPDLDSNTPTISINNYVPPQTSRLKSETVNSSRIMDIVHYRQCNQTWSGDVLGEDCTICSDGCLMTCTTMLLNAHGIQCTPHEVNNNYIQNNQYVACSSGNICCMRYSAPVQYTSSTITFDSKVEGYTLAVIKDVIDAGNPVIANVNGHYVLVVGYNNSGTTASDFLVNDPGRSDGHNRAFNNYTCIGLLIYRNVGYEFNNTISGYIIEQNTYAGLSGVTVSLSDNSSSFTTTSNGSYSFEVPSGWSGTVNVSRSGYTFVPASKTYSSISSDQENQNYSAYIPPVAKFSSNTTTIKAGNSVSFTDGSTNNPNSWNWTFQGGTPSTSTNQNPVITYNTAGSYNVSLTVKNAAGNTSTANKTSFVTVTPKTPPVCDFTMSATQITKGQSVTFTDISANSPTSWSWSFSGGSPISGNSKSQTVSYSSSGTYNISLQTSNADGSSSLVAKTLTVVEPQVIIFGQVTVGSVGMSGVTITFMPGGTTNTDGNGNYSFSVNYNWSGSIEPLKNGYTFTKSILSNVTSNKNIDFAGWTIGSYYINYSPTNPLSGQDINFVLDHGLPVGFEGIWGFGDGSYEYNDQGFGKASHSYSCNAVQDNSFTVTCVITNGTQAINASPVRISMPKCPRFVSAASYTNGCSTVRLGQPAYMTDVSYPYSDLKGLGITWDFGHTGEEKYHVPGCKVCNGEQCGECAGSLYPLSRVFSYVYSKKGNYSVRWQARKEYSQAAETWYGFDVVDCNSIVSSNKLSDCTYSNLGGIDRYWAGTINIAGSADNYVADPNKQIVFTGCNSVVLLPGFSAKPNIGKYFSATANDPCLNVRSLKSAYEPTTDKETDSEIKTDIQYSLTDENFTVNLFPNPNEGNFTVSLDLANNNYQSWDIDIFNNLGVKVKDFKIIQSNSLLIDMSNSPKGIYLLRISKNNKSYYKKLIIN